MALKIRQNVFQAGVLPRTPLGELTIRSSRLFSRLGRGTFGVFGARHVPLSAFQPDLHLYILERECHGEFFGEEVLGKSPDPNRIISFYM